MKIKTKTYLAPDCQVFQAIITTSVLVGSGSSTTEGITIDDDEFVW